jgi:nucleoside-diphosphate-sugar epimerase
VAVAVLQPAEVYGPYGTAWTQNVLRSLKSGREILVDGGSGLVHPVYVDDVVQAMVRAAALPAAPGEAFLIRGPAPLTWREFYVGFENMLGTRATVALSQAEAQELHRRRQAENKLPSVWRETTRLITSAPARQTLRKTREARWASRTARLLPAHTRAALKGWLAGKRNGAPIAESSDLPKPIHVLDPLSIRMAASKTVLSIDKARRLLGYEPRFNFSEGMRRTEQWAKWANLI